MHVVLPSGTAAELALPAGAPTRGIAMVPDIMGLRPLFHDLCARLAAEHGWAVCAIEPFPGQEHLTFEERPAALRAGSDQDRITDLSEAADLLEVRAGVDRIAAMGFCMGGMYTLKAAGTGRYDRAVSFYGMIRLPDGWSGPNQRQPLEWLALPSPTPVLEIVGGRDSFVPPEDVEAFRAMGLGERAQVVVYPEAEHGFVHDPNRPTHRPDDAADAWARVVKFLA